MMSQDNMHDKQREVSPLKWMRNRVGLKQVDLAEVLGVDRVTISSWETGRKEPNLTIRQFKALLKALNISAEELPDSFAPQARTTDGQTDK